MADYAISNIPRRVVYAPSGVGPYAFTFEILDETDIAVYKGSTLLTLTTDYTVSINGTTGTGEVTLVATAGTSNITIVGAKNIQRTSDFTTGGDLFADTLNDELDNQTIFIQQVAETAERGLKAPVTDPTDIAMTLPAKDGRKGKVLAFDSTTGNPVAGPSLDSVVTVIEQSANINTVADNIASVNTVAGNTSNINTVAGVSSSVTTVATNISNVNTVASDLNEDVSEINTVAVDIANVNNVGNNISNVNTVAGVSAAVTTVAGISSAVSNVSSISGAVTGVNTISSAVTGVNSNATNINTVAGINANVTTVAGISGNVSTVAGISSNVTSVAGNSTNINTVAGINAAVSTVATNNTNVSTVATNIASVNTNATNIVAIQNASTNATNAEASALAAAASAASAAASFDAFDDIYLGAKSSNPTVDNDGDALTTGDLYFNTVSNELRVWSGSSWQAASIIGGTVNSLTVTGATALNGGATLGDASGDALTINSSAVSIPNGLNFDSNTFVIDATNNRIGVGVASPSFPLDVSAGFNQPATRLLRVGSYGEVIRIGRSGVSEGASIEYPDDNVLTFNTIGAERIRISGTGNVGIGTSSPSSTLDARGIGSFARTSAGSAIQVANFQNFATDNNTATEIVFNNTTTFNANQFNKIGFVRTNSPVAGDTSFYIGLQNGGGATTPLYLTSTGNLGLGVTPSAWTTNWKAMQIGTASLVGRADAFASYYAVNWYYDGTDRYIGTAPSTLYRQTAGQHSWLNAPSGTAGNAITFTQAMTLDASGNLGIGTTSPVTKLSVYGDSSNIVGGYVENNNAAGSVGDDKRLNFSMGGSSAFGITEWQNAGVVEATSTGGLWLGAYNGAIKFGTGASARTERMRIDSSGNLLVGTTSSQATGTFVRTTSGDTIAAQNTNNGGHANFVSRRAGTSGFAIYFDCDSNQAGTITHPTTTTTVYGTTSDYRLKTVIGNITGAGQRIDALKPIEYEWKEGGRTKGFLAHQFAEVYPNSVSGDKDAVNEEGKPVYQSMQASTPEVMADLIAEIQQLRKRVALLESK